MRGIALGVVSAVMVFAGGAHGATWYVRAAASGSNTGTTWADAFTDLQAALSAAQAGDEIWVGAGTYRPAPANGDRAASFVMKDGVALLGGFAGNEASADQRDWTANPTVLSGDLNADDSGEVFEGTQENSYHVIVAYGVGRGAVLDGFTVRAGHADGPGFGAVPDSQDQGSGMNVYDASPTVRHCIFEWNWSANHGALNDHGHMSVVEDCLFRRNYSEMLGAGLYVHHHSATTVSRCTFRDNTTLGHGAGMYSRSQDGCTVTSCTFTGNAADLGAGMYNAEESANTVVECTFSGNTAITGGAGLYALDSFPIVSGCTFTGNAAGIGGKGGDGGGGGSGGGGIWTEGGHAVITACAFTDNSASFGGGCYNIHESMAEITGCQFDSNGALEAGGVYILNSPVVVSACTFRDNTAFGGSFSVGGAVSNYFSNSVVRGCDFERNSAQLGGGAVYNEGEHPMVLNCAFRANSTLAADAGWGGAVLNGYFTLADVAGCVMTGNRANLGGGVYSIAFAQPSIVNCTIVANEAAAPAPAGGGVFAHELSTSTVAGCIIEQNSPDQLAGGFTAVRRSCVEGGYDGPGADHVLATSAGVVRPPSPGIDGVWGTPDDDDGDLRLAPGSVCIDAGDTPIAAGLLTEDVAGDARYVDDAGVPDSGVGPAPVVDIGAYEFQGRSCLADFNTSGAVNSQDLFDFLAAFFAGNADINRDGATNSQDFFDFLALFFTGC